MLNRIVFPFLVVSTFAGGVVLAAAYKDSLLSEVASPRFIKGAVARCPRISVELSNTNGAPLTIRELQKMESVCLRTTLDDQKAAAKIAD